MSGGKDGERQVSHTNFFTELPVNVPMIPVPHRLAHQTLRPQLVPDRPRTYSDN